MTHNHSSVVPGLFLVAISDSCLSYELVDERVNDNSCDWLCELNEEHNEQLKFGEWCWLSCRIVEVIIIFVNNGSWVAKWFLNLYYLG